MTMAAETDLFVWVTVLVAWYAKTEGTFATASNAIQGQPRNPSNRLAPRARTDLALP